MFTDNLSLVDIDAGAEKETAPVLEVEEVLFAVDLQTARVAATGSVSTGIPLAVATDSASRTAAFILPSAAELSNNAPFLQL